MTLKDVRKAKKKLERERPISRVGEAEYSDYNKRMAEYQDKRIELDRLEKELLERQEMLNHDALGVIANKRRQIANRCERIAVMKKDYIALKGEKISVAERRLRRAEIVEQILDLEEEMEALRIEVIVLEDELIKGL